MDVEDFLELCNEAIRDCERVPERGADFAGSVQDKIESMMDYAEEHDHVTERMADALENMHTAIRKWLRD